MTASIDAEISDYKGYVEWLARRFAGIQGAELDDLVQEGLIAVWLSLDRGLQPSRDFIENRMKMWVRKMRSQIPVDYDELLPLDILEASSD